MIPAAPRLPAAYWRKDHARGLANVIRNTEIQAARDAQACETCGHRNVSHGYDSAGIGATWPDGSRIGRGQCGIDGCTCQAFADAAAPLWEAGA